MYHFCIIICVLVVEIWITCIKCKENAVNHWNIENKPRKMPNLHGNDFIAYVDCIKNIMFKQRLYINYLSKFKRFPLETTNFIGDGSILEDSTWQQSPNHFKILSLHCDINSWHHAKFQPFWIIFHFCYFWKRKKPSLWGSKTMFSHIALPIFLHKASTCGETVR